MKKSVCLLILALFSLPAVSFAVSSFVFVDKDGDLLADIPESSADWVDPDVLYYTTTPEAEKTNLSKSHQKRIEYLSRKIGKPVIYITTSSSLEEIEKMRDGELHIAGFSTGTTGFAVNLAGFIPVCVKAKDDQPAGYHLQVIVKSSSPFHSLQDLKGKQIAHTSPTSNSGNIAPRALLPAFGLIPDETYEVVYSGKHKNSIIGVMDGTYPAAAVASSTLERMMDSKKILKEEIRILYTSPRFPTLAMGYAYNLKPELAAKIRAAFLEYDFAPETVRLYKGLNHYLPISYKDDWEIIRHTADFNGYAYTESGLKKMLNKKSK